MDLNRVFLYGNLTRDPETRNTTSGAQVTKFDIAVNERRSGGKEDEPPMFIRIETWNKTAELVDKYMRKGSAILVEGRLKIDEYETREGQKRRDPVVVADRISFGPKPAASGGSPAAEAGQRRDSAAPAGAGAQGQGAPRSGAAGPGPDEGPEAPEDDLPF